MCAVALAVAIGCAASAAAAGETAKEATAVPAPVAASSGGATCGDPPFDEAKRDAALAALGERLAAEQVAPGDGALNRAGHNYGARPAVAPAAPAAAPSAAKP